MKNHETSPCKMYEENHKISYYDLDFLGRVRLSALLRTVHIAADENANTLKIGFNELAAYNMTFVLQRFAVFAARMPAYGETVKIRTWPDGAARGTFTRKGDMYDTSGKKIMEWASMWVLFDIAERKILKPKALPVKLPEFADHGVKINPEKITPPAESFDEEFSRHTHTVRYADVDTNRHMNNSIYGDLIGNALYPQVDQTPQVWREIQINYQAEARHGEEITVTAYRENDTFFVLGKTSEKTSFTAQIKS